MWIDKNEKRQYNDSKYYGIRLHFYDGFRNYEIEKIKKFCYWLSKKYWFPIRCNLYFSSQRKFQSILDGHTYYGIFYSNDDNRKRYPCICIAAVIENAEEQYDCYFNIAHELTHYFQWYFLVDEEKSKRSLEIMANKWAKYIVEEFYCTHEN